MKILKSVLESLTKRVSLLLEPNDREALCGDLTESGVSGLAALMDLLDLVIRRNLDRLLDLRRCMILVLVVFPIGLALSVVAVRVADETAIYLWLYAENWSAGLIHLPAYWRGMADLLPSVLTQFLVLSSLSFGAGIMVGIASPRVPRFGAAVPICLLLLSGFERVPAALGFIFDISRGRDYFGSTAVFSNAFCRSAYPELIVLLFAVLPFLLGVRKRSPLTGPNRRPVLVSFGTLTCALLCQSLSWAPLHIWEYWPSGIAYLPSPIGIASILPAGLLYLAAYGSCTGR
jgi:hypothetical protein